MEEVQRMGECGETIVIERAWEMTDEAVNWLMREKNYVQMREKGGSGAMSSHLDDADAGEYVLLVQVQRDLESVKKTCVAGKEEIVVERSLVEGGSGDCHELLVSFRYQCLSADQTDDDFRYYRAAQCRLILAPATDPELQPAEAHRGRKHDDWKSCLSNVMDTSKLPDHDEQTPIIRWVVDAEARTDEFHLDLKLTVVSLAVGSSKKDFQATDTCLGFFPDKICLSLHPSWAEMSEAIFQDVPATSHISTTTQTTTASMGIGWGPAHCDVSRAWAKTQPVTDELYHIEYYTEEGGVAGFVWRMCKWANRKHYKSDHNLPLSHSWISKKLPKLPFKGTSPILKDFAAATWRLPITMMHQELSFKLRMCFQMRFFAMKGSDAFAFLRSLEHKTVILERDFKITIQLPAALLSASSTPSN